MGSNQHSPKPGELLRSAQLTPVTLAQIAQPAPQPAPPPVEEKILIHRTWSIPAYMVIPCGLDAR